MDILTVTAQIKMCLKDVSPVSEKTNRNDTNREEIGYYENPLDPNLLFYCFDTILGFDVQYRIAEKVNYLIEFDYKSTFATVGHFKMSYCLSIDKRYKDEIIEVLKHAKPLLEQLFMLIGEQALIDNDFSMKNEAPDYFSKLMFYQERIENLEKRKHIIEEKLRGQYETIEIEGKYKCMRPKGSKYLKTLCNEITYSIETYIDTFFSALEHIMILLCPFINTSEMVKSYYRDFIRNTRWDWSSKIKDVCSNKMPEETIEKLRRIKEVYRNHNAHGGFSREMMAYVQIPSFGRFPMYVGKEYLKGFVNGDTDSISYKMYIDAKTVFSDFWNTLDKIFEIPMLFVRSGLPIPIDTEIYTHGNETAEQAQWFVEKTWFDIDNQSNMDW